MSDETIGLLFWSLLIVLGIPWAIWHYDLNPFNDEIVAYRQGYKCETKNEDSCKWKNLYYTTYKVKPDLQHVISWNSTESWALTKHQDCAIASKKHWSCGSSYRIGFNDGKYLQEDTKYYRVVSKTMWWYREIFFK